jgi:hypothetical protein
MSKKLILLSLVCLISLTSCTKDGAPVSLFFNVDKSAISVDNNVKPKLSGSACSYSVWPWATVGDSSIGAAKNSAGISKVSTLDKNHFSVFTWSPAGWFIRTCSVVTGE